VSKPRHRKQYGDPPKRTLVRGYDGPPCPQCGCATQVREHDRIRRRHLRQPYYYTRWYCCVNHHCATTLIMPEAHKVWNRLPPVTEVQAEFEFRPQDDIVLQVLESKRGLEWSRPRRR
jgi:hypothetical protein